MAEHHGLLIGCPARSCRIATVLLLPANVIAWTVLAVMVVR